MPNLDVTLTPKQFERLVSGEPLTLEFNGDLTVSLTVGDLAAVRLFKLMRETMNVTVNDVIEGGIADATEIGEGRTLREAVRSDLDSALENGYFQHLKQMTPKQVADDLYAQSADIETWIDARAPDGPDTYLQTEVVPLVEEWFKDQEGSA